LPSKPGGIRPFSCAVRDFPWQDATILVIAVFLLQDKRLRLFRFAFCPDYEKFDAFSWREAAMRLDI
jgi:hypothetical protein